jgi:hypothetical protein
MSAEFAMARPNLWESIPSLKAARHRCGWGTRMAVVGVAVVDSLVHRSDRVVLGEGPLSTDVCHIHSTELDYASGSTQRSMSSTNVIRSWPGTADSADLISRFPVTTVTSPLAAAPAANSVTISRPGP